jgi:hypothetical protein
MTSPSKRPLVIGGAVVAVLAAGAIAVTVINGRDDKPATATPTPPAATADALPPQAAPFAYKSTTPYAEVELTLPRSIQAQPELHKRLYDAGVRDLSAFSEGSQADRTEAGGDMGLGPYQKTIQFDSEVETAHLVSLARTDYEFTGGAHGNSTFAGVLWDKSLKAQVTPAALFRRGADLSALDAALCAAVNAEKKARDPAAETLTLGKSADIWSCPKASETAFVLAAGSVPGKAGGLTFLIGPYVVGPYSDGPMSVNVPQSVFRALLDPAYVDEFAGDPTPLPRPAN